MDRINVEPAGVIKLFEYVFHASFAEKPQLKDSIDLFCLEPWLETCSSSQVSTREELEASKLLVLELSSGASTRQVSTPREKLIRCYSDYLSLWTLLTAFKVMDKPNEVKSRVSKTILDIVTANANGEGSMFCVYVPSSSTEQSANPLAEGVADFVFIQVTGHVRVCPFPGISFTRNRALEALYLFNQSSHAEFFQRESELKKRRSPSPILPVRFVTSERVFSDNNFDFLEDGMGLEVSTDQDHGAGLVPVDQATFQLLLGHLLQAESYLSPNSRDMTTKSKYDKWQASFLPALSFLDPMDLEENMYLQPLPTTAAPTQDSSGRKVILLALVLAVVGVAGLTLVI